MAHDGEKNQNEIFGNHKNEEDEFNCNHQRIFDTMDRSFRKYEDESKKLHALTIENIKNLINAWKLKNIHSTKKSQKIPNLPTKTTQETSPEDEYRNIFKINLAQQ